MRIHFDITGRLALILVLFGAALMSGLGALAYTNGRAGLREAATSELLTRATEKLAQLEVWITAARTSIATEAESPVVAELAAALLAAAPGSPEARAAHDRLVTEFRPRVGSNVGFTELFFIEGDTGQVLVSTDPGNEGKFKEDQSYFVNGQRVPYVSDMYYSVSLGRPGMTAAAPVIADGGRLLGVLAGRLDLDVLDTLISRRNKLRQTDDAFLTNSMGLLVTQPRFLPDPAVLKRTLQTEAVKRCLQGHSGVISADDYRGVAALASYNWLPERQMCLIVKIDQAEAFAPILAFGRTVARASGLALALSIVLAFVLARTFTRPILALQAGAARLALGDLDSRLPETRADELGALAQGFNRMAEALQQREAALAESERNYRSLVDNAMVGVYKSNTAGEVLYVNQALAHMMGFDSVEEMRADGAVARYKNSGTRQRLLDALRQAGHAENFEADWLTKQGETKTVLISATQEGDTLIGMSMDITERKQADAEIRERTAQLEAANKELEAFSYSISHDLRAPLRAIDGFARIMEEDFAQGLEPEAKRYLGLIRSGSRQMGTLIDDLLAFSRLSRQPLKKRTVEPTLIARAVLEDLCADLERREVRIELEQLPATEADPALIKQVFANLLGNALKFTRRREVAVVEVGCLETDGEQVYSVRDNGVGFDMRYADKLFGVFQRLHSADEYEGTGVGLAIAQRIIHRHGGRIWAESAPDQGATFYFTVG